MATGTRSPKRRPPARSSSRPTNTAPVAVSGQHMISWRHCFVGLLVGEATLLILSNAGLIATNAAFGSTGTIDGGVIGVSTLLAVIFGGWLAARLAGRAGMYQGIVVAIGFIAVGALFTFLQESIDHRGIAGDQQSPPDRPRPHGHGQRLQRRPARAVRRHGRRTALRQTLNPAGATSVRRQIPGCLDPDCPCLHGLARDGSLAV